MKGRGQRKKPRRLLTVLPAIQFEIVDQKSALTSVLP
jgi:hypothetical protein